MPSSLRWGSHWSLDFHSTGLPDNDSYQLDVHFYGICSNLFYGGIPRNLSADVALHTQNMRFALLSHIDPPSLATLSPPLQTQPVGFSPGISLVCISSETSIFSTSATCRNLLEISSGNLVTNTNSAVCLTPHPLQCFYIRR